MNGIQEFSKASTPPHCNVQNSDKCVKNNTTNITIKKGNFIIQLLKIFMQTMIGIKITT